MQHFQTFIIEDDFTGWESFHLVLNSVRFPIHLFDFSLFFFLCPITAKFKPWEWDGEKKKGKQNPTTLSFSPLSILPTTS